MEEKKEECELLQAKIRFEKDSHSKEIDILQEEVGMPIVIINGCINAMA